MKLGHHLFLMLAGTLPLSAGVTPDTVTTSQGPIKLTPIKHASVMLEFGGKVIHWIPGARGTTPACRRQM